jgi:hypothetical protein
LPNYGDDITTELSLESIAAGYRLSKDHDFFYLHLPGVFMSMKLQVPDVKVFSKRTYFVQSIELYIKEHMKKE